MVRIPGNYPKLALFFDEWIILIYPDSCISIWIVMRRWRGREREREGERERVREREWEIGRGWTSHPFNLEQCVCVPCGAFLECSSNKGLTANSTLDIVRFYWFWWDHSMWTCWEILSNHNPVLEGIHGSRGDEVEQGYGLPKAANRAILEYVGQ